jgi:hypothetical protein
MVPKTTPNVITVHLDRGEMPNQLAFMIGRPKLAPNVTDTETIPRHPQNLVGPRFLQ